eukprot:scaffold10575_cov275-Chaetoceros_neogracile.AAC.6
MLVTTIKSTYCNGMQQYMRLIGRETLVVNLDPANEFHHKDAETNASTKTKAKDKDTQKQSPSSHLPYDVILDASEDIINLSSVMSELSLGPNGGLIYCLEYIHHHIETLIEMLTERIDAYCQNNAGAPAPYLLFDFPGQVELFTHNTSVQSILDRLVKEMDLRLAAIHLVDAHSCADASKFISAALLSTTTMLRLELPAVNVLSKIDLLSGYGDGSIPFNLDYFVECQDLERLLPYLEGNGVGTDMENGNMEDETERMIMEDEEYRKARFNTRNTRFYKRYHKLHRELCEVIDDYSLLSYIPLDINDAASVGRLVARIDKCNGYVFTGRSRQTGSTSSDAKSKDTNKNNIEDMFQCAMQADSEWGYEQIADVQERFMGTFQEEVPELKREGA